MARSKTSAGHGAAMAAMAATMPLAMMTTLAHRLPMLFSAMSNPKTSKDPELARMVEEKIDAGMQAARNLSDMAIAGQQALAAYAIEQTLANLALPTELATKTPNRWQQPIQAHGERSLQRIAAVTEKLGNIGSKSLSGSIKPAHSRVLANAKRLSNKSRKAR